MLFDKLFTDWVIWSVHEITKPLLLCKTLARSGLQTRLFLPEMLMDTSANSTETALQFVGPFRLRQFSLVLQSETRYGSRMAETIEWCNCMIELAQITLLELNAFLSGWNNLEKIGLRRSLYRPSNLVNKYQRQ